MTELNGAEDAMAELLCPICWELPYRPHRLNPCLHLFCDPCLRRLNRASFDTCPICRTFIRECHLDEELHNSIENQHQDVYIQRQQEEIASGIFNEPLPLAEDDSDENSEDFDFIVFLGKILGLLILYSMAKCFVIIVEFIIYKCYGIFFGH